MTFDLRLVTPDYDLPNYDTPSGRFYKVPDGSYVPSVTTKLGKYFDKSEVLTKWRERVGDAEADKITRQGIARGEALHKVVEKYILGEDWKTGAGYHTKEHFRKIRKDLDDNIDIVYGVELPLYSMSMRTAGRTDLVCNFQGIPTVLDNKTSRYDPPVEWITNYFVQATCYADMLNQFEFGIPKIEQIAILMACDFGPRCLWIKKITPDMIEATRKIMISTDIAVSEELCVSK